MAETLVLDNEFAKVTYDEKSGIIHHEWKKFCFGENFQKLMMNSTQYLKAHKGNKWLSDDRNFSVMTEEDTKWGREVWWPETKSAGWKYWAILLPTKTVGKINIKGLIQEYSAGGITAQVFESVEEAKKWLEAQ
ncbi:MAG TPA: hypothetical protein PLP41_11880 [Treponemataceae bacterium]|nr:hypothetical protein [Treponemataceae bacterium]